MSRRKTAADDAAKNVRRAADALQALRAYAAATYALGRQDIIDAELPTLLTDLLADLRHLAVRQGLDYAEADRLADMHFQTESREEQPGKDRPGGKKINPT